MREDLLGYLLNALDAAERERVEEALRTNPVLRRQLEELKERLLPIDENSLEFEPPPGLAERTCEIVDDAAAAFAELPPSVAGRREANRAGRYFSNSDWRDLANGRRGWSALDSIVTAGLCLVVAMLFFPAIANSRFQSQMAGCQYNLTQVGLGLTNYSEKKGGYFPEIPRSGNRSVAGIYAPTLMDQGYILDQSLFLCPSSRLAHHESTWRMPSLVDLDLAEGLELRALQRTIGGSYGYSLGYLRNGQYSALRNDGRSHFALMSDAPSLHLPGHQSSNHGGLGQNVLFEDNRVQFMSSGENDRFYERIFLNKWGFAAPGVDRNDSVIGQSFTSPFQMQDMGLGKS